MVIGIDTSGLVCSVAVVDGAGLICEFSLNHKKTHSEQLLPIISMCLERAELSINDADCFAVANGPGSFTGLRIGAATAKGLALGTEKPVIGVSSLLALGCNLAYSGLLVVPVMDARRNEVYTAAYDFSRGIIPEEIISPRAVAVYELAELLNDIKRPVILLGDGVPVYGDSFKELLTVSLEFAPAHMNGQRAASVAVLGQHYLETGEYGDVLSISYLRRPQAERERLGL